MVAKDPSTSSGRDSVSRDMSRIYLDDAGFAPVLPEVQAALLDVPEGARRQPKRGTIVTWAAEHQSVLGAVRRLQSEGHSVEVAQVDASGRADPGDIPSSAALVSIGLANNEVGTVQPIAAIIARAHEVGALVHVDACAGPRWIGMPEGADVISFSGHKLGAGRGGILFVRDAVRVDPLLYGGPQEWGRRAGREDVGAALAVATALSTCQRDRLERGAVAARQASRLRALLVELGGVSTGAESWQESQPRADPHVRPGRWTRPTSCLLWASHSIRRWAA